MYCNRGTCCLEKSSNDVVFYSHQSKQIDLAESQQQFMKVLYREIRREQAQIALDKKIDVSKVIIMDGYHFPFPPYVYIRYFTPQESVSKSHRAMSISSVDSSISTRCPDSSPNSTELDFPS